MSVSEEYPLATSRENEDIEHSWAVLINKKSPYQDSKFVTLLVGPRSTEFSVHKSILEQSKPLSRKFSPFSAGISPAQCPDLNESIAHTLFHYLYTGNYDVLDSSINLRGDVNQALEAYIYATRVYCAAMRYEIPGLADLAREQITALDADISIPEKLKVVRKDAFPQLPEDDTWYATYVHVLITNEMRIDAAWYRTPEFVGLIEGNPRLLRVAWTAVTSFSDKEVETPVLLDGHETPVRSVSAGEDEVSAVDRFCAPKSPPALQEPEQRQEEHSRSDSAVQIDEDTVMESNSWNMSPKDEVTQVMDGEDWPKEKVHKKKKGKKSKKAIKEMEILSMGV